MPWLRRMLSSGEPSFCLRRNTMEPAKVSPLATARRFPASPPTDSSSRKKSTMPARTIPMVSQSTHETRSRRNIQPRIAAKTGAVYCSRMAFAAVVSLLATTKPIIVAA